ncbi:hypothetical protein NIES4071_43890 [Calothrix sp. NIES-4071]|nr:hypothetical protein NIES4071_43890 [Calothrix sp. NIES-4071]BAZ58703.1 hypothetical protein NIES4105_43820 [Calothrix sp. NIES-4105]
MTQNMTNDEFGNNIVSKLAPESTTMLSFVKKLKPKLNKAFLKVYILLLALVLFSLTYLLRKKRRRLVAPLDTSYCIVFSFDAFALTELKFFLFWVD